MDGGDKGGEGGDGGVGWRRGWEIEYVGVGVGVGVGEVGRYLGA